MGFGVLFCLLYLWFWFYRVDSLVRVLIFILLALYYVTLLPTFVVIFVSMCE